MTTSALERQIGVLTLRFRQQSAAATFVTVLRELERRNWEDQPRVPAGRREGGQWTDEDGTSEDRQGVALAAPLIGQRVGIVNTELKRMCTYMDMFGRQYSAEYLATEVCPPTLVVPPYHGLV